MGEAENVSLVLKNVQGGDDGNFITDVFFAVVLHILWSKYW